MKVVSIKTRPGGEIKYEKILVFIFGIKLFRLHPFFEFSSMKKCLVGKNLLKICYFEKFPKSYLLAGDKETFVEIMNTRKI